MSTAPEKNKLATMCQITLFASICFAIFSAVWLSEYETHGDMGRGMARIFGALYIFIIAAFLLTISSTSRLYLVLKNEHFRTRRQYILLITTAVPSVVFLLSLAGYFLILFYESYIM